MTSDYIKLAIRYSQSNDRYYQVSYFRRVNWVQRFELRVWPQHKDKDCFLITYRRTITPSSSTAPRVLRTLIISDFLTPKNQIRTRGNEKRFSSLSFNSLISSMPPVPSMALARRSFVPLLALTPLPLAQQFYASA